MLFLSFGANCYSIEYTTEIVSKHPNGNKHEVVVANEIIGKTYSKFYYDANGRLETGLEYLCTSEEGAMVKASIISKNKPGFTVQCYGCETLLKSRGNNWDASPHTLSDSNFHSSVRSYIKRFFKDGVKTNRECQ
jgi:hypothetical protein